MGRKRYVVKVGSSLLTNEIGVLDREYLKKLCLYCAKSKEYNTDIILVTSGAVATGVGELNRSFFAKNILDKQILASIGQVSLMDEYATLFKQHNRTIAQLLLTRSDVQKRDHYLMIRNIILGLLEHNIIPVINENDTVSTEEICFGDNDTLAALVASKIDADYLIMLTDVDGLYKKCPKESPCAEHIERVHAFDEIADVYMGQAGTSRATGGMETKIRAAKIAHSSGVTVIIANGKKENVLSNFFTNNIIGTTFIPEKKFLSHRERWLAFGAKVTGSIIVDAGAKEAIFSKGKSLLPAGVIGVKGVFHSGDVVEITDKDANVIAQGIVSYSSEDVNKLQGCKTRDIENILGYKYYDEIIHRDNLVLIKKTS